jgi:NAD(P)-dependent dehydrogenase (short-subunit alcohol dehydrogenase family)
MAEIAGKLREVFVEALDLDGDAIRFLVSDEASFITGQVLDIDGGLAL